MHSPFECNDVKAYFDAKGVQLFIFWGSVFRITQLELALINKAALDFFMKFPLALRIV